MIVDRTSPRPRHHLLLERLEQQSHRFIFNENRPQSTAASVPYCASPPRPKRLRAPTTAADSSNTAPEALTARPNPPAIAAIPALLLVLEASKAEIDDSSARCVSYNNAFHGKIR